MKSIKLFLSLFQGAQGFNPRIDVDYQQALEILSSFGQGHVLQYWSQLNSEQRQDLLFQIQRLDFKTLQQQKKLVHESSASFHAIEPFDGYATAGNTENRRIGDELIAKGLVGCLIVAGGQGSRLRSDCPKGTFPVTKVNHKSLFQLFSEKTLAAGRKANRLLPLAIMTSPSNHEETLDFFHKHHFFGLDRQQVVFFTQELLPLLDVNGNLFLETINTLSQGPDGNGGAIYQFVKKGIWKDWYDKGIRYLCFIPVDNALADPFDAELIGYHQQSKGDVTIKCIQRRDSKENVGILAKENGRITVVEYSELSSEEKNATYADSSLRYPLANISLFSFHMDFIKVASEGIESMPLHKAFKAVKYLNDQEATVQADTPMAWKFERFIFDILPMASKVHALLYPREVCFAPLKNFKGSDSLESVLNAIESRDRQVISAITGQPCHYSPIEISQEFYYPTTDLIARWKGRVIPHGGYIEEKMSL